MPIRILIRTTVVPIRILIRMMVVPINIDYYMSLVMRKPAFCKCENKDADQLCGNRTADQRLCFCYIDTQSLCFLNPKFKPLAIFSDCTARFVSDLVGNPEDRFSHNKAHIYVSFHIIPRINLRRPYQPETPVSARGLIRDCPRADTGVEGRYGSRGLIRGMI